MLEALLLPVALTQLAGCLNFLDTLALLASCTRVGMVLAAQIQYIAPAGAFNVRSAVEAAGGAFHPLSN